MKPSGKRVPIEREAGQVKEIYDIYHSPGQPGETEEQEQQRKAQAIARLGGLPPQIMQRVAAGELSLTVWRWCRFRTGRREAVGKERSRSNQQGTDVSSSSAGGDPGPVHRTPRESAWEHSESYEATIQKLESLIEPVAQARRDQAKAKAALRAALVNAMRPGGLVEIGRALKSKEAAEARLESLIEECRSLVEVPEQLRGIVRLRGDARALPRAREGMDLAARYTARDLLPENLEVVYSTENRAGHEKGKIHINESTGLSVVAHEITHEAELLGEGILFRALAFLKMRASGTPLVNLREYTGNNLYEPDEWAWLDRWEELGGTIYSGKDCGDAATEILTKGIERLNQDPLLFFMTDPEYFEFVTRTLNPP